VASDPGLRPIVKKKSAHVIGLGRKSTSAAPTTTNTIAPNARTNTSSLSATVNLSAVDAISILLVPLRASTGKVNEIPGRAVKNSGPRANRRSAGGIDATANLSPTRRPARSAGDEGDTLVTWPSASALKPNVPSGAHKREMLGMASASIHVAMTMTTATRTSDFAVVRFSLPDISSLV